MRPSLDPSLDLSLPRTPSPVLLLAAKSSLEISQNEYLKTTSKLTIDSPSAFQPKHLHATSQFKPSTNSEICLKSTSSWQRTSRPSEMPDVFIGFSDGAESTTLKADSKLRLLMKDSVILSIAQSERKSISRSICDSLRDKPEPHLLQDGKGVGQKKLLLAEDSLDIFRSISRNSDTGLTLGCETASLASSGTLDEQQKHHSTVMFDDKKPKLITPKVVAGGGAIPKASKPLLKRTEVGKPKSKAKAVQKKSVKAKPSVKTKKVVDPHPYEYDTEEKILAIVDVLKTDVDLLRLFTPCSQ